ncbi:anti-repressor SinI family protein [Ectobacillus sp. sgz5001026]
MVSQYEPIEELDQEWVELMLEAKKRGITPKEILLFLQAESKAS